MWPQSCAVGSVQTPPPTMTLTFFALAMHEHLLARNTSLLSSHQSLEKTGADYFSKLYLSLFLSALSLQTRALSSQRSECKTGVYQALSTNYRFICSNFLIFLSARVSRPFFGQTCISHKPFQISIQFSRTLLHFFLNPF